MLKYKNRNGDVYTFSETDDGNILWEGPFEWYRSSWPNVYDKAYSEYLEDGGKLPLEEFKVEIHEPVYDEQGNYQGMSELSQKYGSLVYSNEDVISMVDPSGGPYIEAGMKASDLFQGKEGVVSEFEKTEKGFKIIIK